MKVSINRLNALIEELTDMKNDQPKGAISETDLTVDELLQILIEVRETRRDEVRKRTS